MAKASVEKTITDLIKSNSWGKLAKHCEDWEYECAENPDAHALPFYSVHLLVYMIENELSHARFLWKRIPAPLKESDPELSAIWAIGREMWAKNPTNFYKALTAFNWSPGVAALITALAESYRRRMFDLVAKAYSTITVSDCATLLGLAENDTTKLAAENGWEVDSSSGMLCPKIPLQPKQQSTGLPQLQQLTDYVVFLEQQW
ncbi:COP9 signalosome complex subunit 8 [Balamuthia mandrillaris]